jgi:hypothetical protein
MSISIIFSNAHLSNCPDYSTSAKVSQWLGMEFHTQILRPTDLFSKIGNLILTKPSPTQFNINYCNADIKQVYHELFDDALERYNAKQTRADRKIKNYYEKIRTSKQEKTFHELILQIGNQDDMSATSENGELAKAILDEYYQDFQARNPNLRVFSAHLHMDETTPHLHIDFIPFTTGSKRGLDTRVSLKQALAAQGFKGGTRGDTEWNQWVQAEKEQLALVMERHDIQWEHLGTHEEHLSVLDYKKQERLREVAELDEKLAEKDAEYRAVTKQISNFEQGVEDLSDMTRKLDDDPEYQLPDPPTLMSARTYKAKFVDLLVKRLKELLKSVLTRYFLARDEYQRLNVSNGKLYRENERLSGENGRLSRENARLKEENRDYGLLEKVFGKERLNELVEQAKQERQAKQQEKRLRRSRDYER